MKAISTIIASILMLTITIALAGTAYLYVSGVFTGKTSTTFSLVDSVNDTVIIRNDGTEPIDAFSSVKIDGNDAVYRVSKQDSSLVGYWKMDESSWTNDCTTNSIKDSSDKNNNGKSCTGGADYGSPASGYFGNGAGFTSNGGYIQVPHSASLGITQEITIETWIKTNSDTWERPIQKFQTPSGGNVPLYGISARGDVNLGWGCEFASSSPGIYVYVTDPTQYNTGQWYHVVCTGSKLGNYFKVYVGGVQKASASWFSSGDIANEARPLNIGGNRQAPFFSGMIDEVKIYNRALSAQEIKAEYDIGSQINPGEIATMKIYNQLSRGTHTLRLCTSSMCNTAILAIQ